MPTTIGSSETQLYRERRLGYSLEDFPTPAVGEQVRSELLRRLNEVEQVAIADRNYLIDPAQPMWAGEETTTTAFIFIRSFNVRWPDLSEAVGYPETTIGNLDYNRQYYVYFIDSDRDGKPDSCFFATPNRAEVMPHPSVVYLGGIMTPASPGQPAVGQTEGGSGGGSPDPPPGGDFPPTGNQPYLP